MTASWRTRPRSRHTTTSRANRSRSLCTSSTPRGCAADASVAGQAVRCATRPRCASPHRSSGCLTSVPLASSAWRSSRCTPSRWSGFARRSDAGGSSAPSRSTPSIRSRDARRTSWSSRWCARTNVGVSDSSESPTVSTSPSRGRNAWWPASVTARPSGAATSRCTECLSRHRAPPVDGSARWSSSRSPSRGGAISVPRRPGRRRRGGYRDRSRARRETAAPPASRPAGSPTGGVLLWRAWSGDNRRRRATQRRRPDPGGRAAAPTETPPARTWTWGGLRAAGRPRRGECGCARAPG